MDLKKKILKRTYRFNNKNKEKVYNIYSILNDMKKFKNLDYWDYKGYHEDFDRWCDSKNYGAKDKDGNIRSHSNIWFLEQQKDIDNKKWAKAEYCAFIDIFCDSLFFPQISIPDDYLNGDENEELDFNWLLKISQEKDIQQYGKEDYRTHLATELKNLFGENIYITGGEE